MARPPEESPNDAREPRVRPLTAPEPLPVYNCLAYVSRQPDGQVAARAANLPELQATGGSEREALQQLVHQFKQHLGQLFAQGSSIVLKDPPLPIEPGEQARWIAVHL